MRPTRVGGDGYWILGALLFLIAAVCATVITSCGGGGSSNGGLCEQCGNSPDGPCQPHVQVEAGPDVPVCDNPLQVPPCLVSLTCLRKLGSAQRRCFPANVSGLHEPNLQFRCDGERANRSTPGPTATPTLTPTPTPTFTAAAVCGNGTAEGTEQCDGTDFRGETCLSHCGVSGGSLDCNTDCTLSFLGCFGSSCS